MSLSSIFTSSSSPLLTSSVGKGVDNEAVVSRAEMRLESTSFLAIGDALTATEAAARRVEKIVENFMLSYWVKAISLMVIDGDDDGELS